MIVLVARRAVLDYARRPLNLVLLVAVPVVLVFVWGNTLADFSELLGGTGDRVQLEAATAGWAAAALAGLAGFFQVSGSAAADRRLAAGHRTAAVVAGRIGAAVGLALLASAGGLVALAVRAGIDDPTRAVSATLLFAMIYLALGVLIGTLVRSEMNGALLITLIWVFDVFFGPAMGTSSVAVTRMFPLHFPTLVVTDQVSGHPGPLSDVGWSLAWAVGLSILAVARLAADTRPASPGHTDPPLTLDAAMARPLRARHLAVDDHPAVPTVVHRSRGVRLTPNLVTRPAATTARLSATLRAGMREYRRNRVLWIMLLVVPVVFIVLAIAVTPDAPGRVAVVDGSRHFTALLSERRMHAATMVPITSAFLAGLTGLFVVTGSAGGDRRLVLAGFRPREVLAGRLGVIGAASVLTTVVAVAVAGAWYPPRQWAVFAAANLLIALTYAMVGALVGPLTGRLGGLYLILLLAFIDVGLGQTIMFDPSPPEWGAFLPARGASRVLIDGAFTAQFDEVGYLLLAMAWLTGLTAATIAVFHRRTASKAA